jgi:hypothetical protein
MFWVIMVNSSNQVLCHDQTPTLSSGFLAFMEFVFCVSVLDCSVFAQPFPYLSAFVDW